MTQYELMCLFRYENEPDGTLPPKLEVVLNALQKYYGTVLSQEDFGIRRLAYPIKRETTGHYMVFNVNMEKKDVQPLTAYLTIEQSLLRHQMITYVKTQAPREEKHEEETIEPEKPSQPAVATVHTPMSSDDLDKTLERILEEKVL